MPRSTVGIYVWAEGEERTITTETPTRKSKHTLLILLKVVVTLALCAVLVTRADWGQVRDALRGANPAYVAVVFVLMVLSVTISAYKWKLLLSIHGVAFRFPTLHRYYFIGAFFNNFLPTSIGGDGYRIYKTLANERSRAAAVLAVFTERVTGIGALLVLGYASGIVLYLRAGDPLSRWVVTVGTVGVVAGIPFLIAVTNRRVLDRLVRWHRLPSPVRSLVEHWMDYRSHPARSLGVIAISFSFHLHLSIVYMLLLLGVGASGSLLQLFVVLTVTNILAVLPISINGIGVIDGSFIYLMGLYGVPYDQAFAVMLLSRALVIPISVIGAIFYFSNRKKVAVRQAV